VLLGVLPGILVAVVLSVANVFRRVWMPHDAILGKIPGVRGFHDVARHPGIEVLPGAVILRFDAPLIFANARTFRDRVRKLSETLPAGGWIIVAAEPVTDIDTTACDMLQDLTEVLATREQTLVLAELKSGPLAKLHRFGLDRTFAEDRIFPTVGAAADAYREISGSQWVPAADGRGSDEHPHESGSGQ
jgi:MFS superfamily sulfate permease-like transporter